MDPGSESLRSMDPPWIQTIRGYILYYLGFGPPQYPGNHVQHPILGVVITPYSTLSNGITYHY